ncbi:hypothetical protein UPYG_G00037960 [Umbra pygmaea]|uniref:Ig-like domain-containing protein n=1 Tax=Umbra pygmaea TaxID=75934 RepID=A0ABD0Y826_UMBPY
MGGKARVMLYLLVIINGLHVGVYLGFSMERLSVKVGEDAMLECPLKCPLSTNCSKATVSWYKLSPGKTPELVLSYRLANTSRVIYGQGFYRNKFTVHTNFSRPVHQHQLLIHRSEENDLGVYYCGLSNGLKRNNS